MVYGCDDDGFFTAIGPETKARCDRLIALLKDEYKKCRKVILLTAGTKQAFKGCPPLRDLMQLYLLEKLYAAGIENCAFLMAQENAWGTYEETRVAAKFLSTDAVLVAITSGYHIRRVLKIWELIKKGIVVISIPTEYVSFRRLLEPLKFLKVFWDHFILEKKLSTG